MAAQTTVPVVLSQRKISGSAWALLRALRPAAEARLAPLFTKAVMEPKFQHQRPRPGTDPTVAAAASLPRPPLVLRRHNCVQALHKLSSNLGGRVYGSREGSARGVRGARAHLRRGTVRRLEGRDGFTRSAARGKGMLEITEGPARGAGDSCAAGLCARLLCCGTVRRRTFVPHLLSWPAGFSFDGVMPSATIIAGVSFEDTQLNCTTLFIIFERTTRRFSFRLILAWMS